MHFQGRSFLSITDFSKAEIEYLIDFSIHLKKLKKNKIPHQYLKGQNIALLFEKVQREQDQLYCRLNDPVPILSF